MPMEKVVVLFLLLWLQLGFATDNNLDSILDGFNHRNQKQQDLSCHVCHSETDHRCMNLSSYSSQFDNEVYSYQFPDVFSEKCPERLLDPVCMVRKFAFTVTKSNGTLPMKTFSIKRNCTEREKCENACVIMGERTRIYVCSTCCSTPMCNTGNMGSSLHANSILLFPRRSIPIISIITLFMLISRSL